MANALKRKRAPAKGPVDANAILALLVRHRQFRDGLTVSGIAGKMSSIRPRKPGYAELRATILNGVGQLLRQGLTARQCVGEQRYVATQEGIAFHRAGKKVARARGVTPPNENTYRAKIWKALRIVRKASIPELVEMAAADTSTKQAIAKASAQARTFLWQLKRAGIVAPLPVKDGIFKRFALLRDLGPLMPERRKTGLFDPNKRELIPFPEVKS